MHDYSYFCLSKTYRKMKKYAFVILVMVITTGCKKKNEPKPATPPPVLLTGIKYVAPGTPDSLVYNYVYKYNTSHQLTDVYLGSTDYPFKYSPSGQLISYGGVGRGGISMLFAYDQNNNPAGSTVTTYDEFSQPQNVEYFRYSISNGRVAQINELNGPNGAVAVIYNLIYDDAGNIIEKDIINSDGSVRETNKYTYGSHHSPFYTDHIKLYLSPDLDDNYFNPNEILTQTSVNSLGTTQFTFTYIYNGLFPTSMVITAGGVNNYYYYSYSGLTN